MTCVSCQRNIADGSKFCPYCGSVQPDSARVAPSPPAPADVLPPVGAGAPAPLPSGLPPGPSQRATTAMMLGIASIALSFLGCCCYAIPSLFGGGLGIAAYVMGRNELEDIRAGLSPAAGESNANTAKITGIIGISIAVLAVGIVVVALLLGVAQNFGKIH